MKRYVWLLFLLMTFTLGCGGGAASEEQASAERVAQTAAALTAIDTRPSNGTVTPFGQGGAATFGQTITVPPNDAVLQGFAFQLASVPSTVVFRGEVYAWNGTIATGPNLYESAPTSTTGATTQLVTFNTGNLALTPGQQYVLFASTAKDVGTGNGAWAYRTGDVYPGGAFVYQFTGTTPANWTTMAWSNIGATNDAAFTATFDHAPSTTALVSSANPSVFGQSVTFTATVTGTGGTATGTVTFMEGLTTLGTATLNGAGQASFSTSGLLVASHNITASYGGSPVYFPSTSSVLTQVVDRASTTTSVASSVNPSVVGGGVTFMATVTPVAPSAGSPSGTVTFMDGAATLGTGTIAGGIATFATSALTAGSHSVTAVYGGDPNFVGSTSPALNQGVNQDGTTVSIGSSSNPSTFGTSVTFTATVTTAGTGGIPTGTVTFREGLATLGTGTLNAGGTATFATAALTGGSHTITADYGGDANHTAASGSMSQVVNVGASATALASATNPSVYGQSVTFTATVTGTGATATGTVTFLDGATPLGTGTLNGAGQASFSTSSLSVATHSITAAYAGDTNFGTSTSSVISQVVNKAGTSTALASSSNPSIIGSSVTFTATVTATAPGAGTATGTVTFTEGGTTLGTGTLNVSGVATFTTSSLTVGTHAITASFGGDGNFVASTSSNVAQVVSQDAVTATITSSLNPSTYGASVTFTATVASAGTGGTPTGTVTFNDGGNALGSGALDASGVATLATAALTGGSHSITAVYGGDTNHAGGSSAALTQVVNVATTTTTLVASTNPSVFGQSVTFTATVASAATGTPTGTVTFMDGATTLGTGTLGASGTTTLTTGALAVATHPISAVYAGDTNYATSTSTALSQVVNKAATSTALASSTNPSLIGTNVTFTATVTVSAPGAGAATGTVTFKDGTTTLGTGTLNGTGVATFATSTLTVGAHPITAEYGGDGNVNTSASSSALTQNVTSAAATIAVTAVPTPSTFGASVTFTATVTGAKGTPTGAIAFKDGTAALGNGTLDSMGVATISSTMLAAGTHTITADYLGDATYAVGSGTVSHVVTKADTKTTLVSAKNPSTVGDSVTFTATVTSAVAGFTGDVEILDGTTSLGNFALNGGTATFSTSALKQGGHAITASYKGDSNFNASSSVALMQTVDAAATANDGGAGDGGGPEAGRDGGDAGGDASGGDASGLVNLEVNESGGCGCRVSTAPGGAPGMLALAGIALLVARRRRRR